MEYKNLPPKLQQMLSNIDQSRMSLKDMIDDAMAKARSPSELVRILSEKGALDGVIGTLDMVLNEFKDPMLVVSIETHPCDGCEVVLNNLDADVHCHKCRNEKYLESFVPEDMRNLGYTDATEVSAEDE